MTQEQFIKEALKYAEKIRFTNRHVYASQGMTKEEELEDTYTSIIKVLNRE